YDGQVLRLLHADRGERSQPHEHLAVAGDDEHPAPRLRERKAETHHRRLTHRAPERKAERRIARRGDVPRGRAETGDDQKVSSLLQELGHDLPSMGNHWLVCSWKLLMPITRCGMSTATDA